MLGIFVLLAVLCGLAGCPAPSAFQPDQPTAPASSQERAKYVFLFVGDGMGANQRMVAELYLGGPAQPGRALDLPRLKMNSLPVAGLTRTSPWDSHVTDSAAAATALATGRKTRVGRLSVDPERDLPLPTFAEIAREKGWRIGLVSSSPIDDATPAAFYAHESSRGNRYAITRAAAESGFTYLAGGGPSGAIPDGSAPRESPLDLARAKGFQLVHTRSDLLALQPGGGPVWAFRVGPDGHPRGMSYDQFRPPEEPSLAEYTRKGIELLENERGFFLLVEGGLIDAAGHGNCLATTVREVLALDAAVEEALRFYARHPDETLIVVTGDHETGGLSLGSARANYDRLREWVDRPSASLPVLGEALAKWRAKQTPFEEALPQILEMTGGVEPDELELAELRTAYAESLKGLEYSARTPDVQRLYGSLDPLQTAMYKRIAAESGVTWTTAGHSAQPVMTTAVGPGSRPFGSYHENADIFRFLMRATGLELSGDPAGP
jgi:alkaline phosphatase